MTAQLVGPFGPITDYLPHRPPMVFLDEIVASESDRVVCRSTLRPDCIFAVDGQVHPAAMIEFVAQACGVYMGLRPDEIEHTSRLGFIMGCREVTFAVDSFAVGDVLTVTASKVYGQTQIASFVGTVSRGDELCVSVQLSVVDAGAAAVSFVGESP